MRTARQALTDIAALCDEQERKGGVGFLRAGIDNLRAVLADVEPRPAVVLDRDVLMTLLLHGDVEGKGLRSRDARALADRIFALVSPMGDVALTRDEATEILLWKRAYDHRYGRDKMWDGLHNRLEGAS